LARNGALEDSLHGAMQAASISGRKTCGLGQGMNSRVKQRLVGVNVAETGEHLLIEQPSLDGASSAPHGQDELLFGNLARVRTEPTENGLQLLGGAATQPPESAGIAITNLFRASVQNEADVGVRFDGGLARHDDELSGHAQPHHEKPFCVVLPQGRLILSSSKLYRQRLPLAMQTLDAPASEVSNELTRAPCDH
jgi:hypothetical protein